MKYAWILIFIFCAFKVQAQGKADSAFQSVENFIDYLWNRDHDTTYITSYNNKLNVRLLAVNKFTFFSLRDKVNNSVLRYRPEYGLNFGAGVTYNWFSIDMAFNVGIREDKIPNSNFFDFQGVVFSTKFLIDASLKYYYGYQVNSGSGIESDVDQQIRSDIRTINLGISFLYALRYDKFSIKAPFVFNEVQRRSAGSPIFGASFTSYTLDADSSVVDRRIQDEFDMPLRNLQGVNMLSLAVNIGYIYTFVAKERYFVSLGIIPGISLNSGDYATRNRVPRDLYVSGNAKTVFAIGYNHARWYGGLQLMADFDLHRLEQKMHLVSSHGKSKFYLGYRIHRKKK